MKNHIKKNNLTTEQDVYRRVLASIEKKKMEKEKNEKDKNLILWSGVIFFMVLIFFFWLFNFKKSIMQVENQPANDFDWLQIGSDLNETMGDMKVLFNGFEPMNSGGRVDEKKLEELKKELEKEKLDDGSATSTDFIEEGISLPSN